MSKTAVVALLALALALSAHASTLRSELLVTKVMPPKNTELSVQVGNELHFDENYEALPQPYRSYRIRATAPRGQKLKLFGWLTCDGFRVKNFSPRFVGSFTHVVKIPSAYLSAGYCSLTFGLSRFAHLLETGSARGRIVVRVFAALRSAQR